MLGDIKQYFVGEWHVIAQAPATFGMVILLMAVMMWMAFTWIYKQRLEHKDLQIQLQDRQLNDYKDKLQVASPDEAKVLIEELRERLNQFEPRRLSSEQKIKLIRFIRLFGAPSRTLHIGYDVSCPDGNRYASEIADAIKNAGGWNIVTPMVGGVALKAACGLGLYVSDKDNLTLEEGMVANALDAAGITFELLQRPRRRHDGTGRRDEPDAELLISTPLAHAS